MIYKIHNPNYKIGETHQLICNETSWAIRYTVYFYVLDKLRDQIAFQIMGLVKEQIKEMELSDE